MSDNDYLQLSNNAKESIIHFDHDKYFSDLEKVKCSDIPEVTSGN